ncbi:MAG: nucleotidyltransferase domain-containing protein [Candidatus Hadarchaeia archaeon]
MMMDFLGSEASVRIVELFCQNPNEEFYSKKVGDKLGISKATNIKWLKRLTDAGILTAQSRGRKKFYKLKLNNPLARQLRILMTLSELIPRLKDQDTLRSAYLVGSSAKGTHAPDSPLELLILHRGDPSQIRSVLDDVSSKIGREIEAKIMTPLEYAELSKDKPKLHERLEREKIRIVLG